MNGPSMTRADLRALLPDLSDDRLAELTDAGLVQPVLGDGGPRFRDIDVARLQLALDLQDAFELHDEALTLVLSLIDQVHGLRGEMRAVLGALAEEPPETRARLRGVIRRTIVRVQR